MESLNRVIYAVLIAVIVAFGISIIKNNSNTDGILKENKRIVDSLEARVKVYQRQYDSLRVVATKLDSMIVRQEERLKNTRGSFGSYKSGRITSSDSAFKYLLKFIRE